MGLYSFQFECVQNRLMDFIDSEMSSLSGASAVMANGEWKVAYLTARQGVRRIWGGGGGNLVGKFT